MRVRAATRDDLLGVGRVAEAAFWDSYTGFLRSETIAAILRAEFGPSVIKRRLLQGGVLVADERAILGFVDGVPVSGALEVSAVAVEPRARHRGIGRALIAEVRRLHPGLPLRADVLLGNLGAERLFEGLGFVPGEIVTAALDTEDVIARRWWSEPVAGMRAAAQ